MDADSTTPAKLAQRMSSVDGARLRMVDVVVAWLVQRPDPRMGPTAPFGTTSIARVACVLTTVVAKHALVTVTAAIAKPLGNGESPR